jgi:O-antigen/teichoic acid export membrane protein
VVDRASGASSGRRRLGAYLRLRPFDSSTPEGRSAERYRRAAWASLAGVLSRFVALGVTLITIPLALGHLGTERYGVWVTITSVTALLTFADLGLGYGLMNIVSEANGRDDRSAAASAIASASVMLATIAGAATILVVVASSVVPWGAILNVRSETAVAEAGPASLVMLLCFAANIPLGLVVQTEYGYQRGYLASFFGVLGSIAGLAGLVVAVDLGAGLPWLVLALAGAPVAANALNWLVFFQWTHPDLRPRWRLASRAAGARLLRTGWLFVVLQVAAGVASQGGVLVSAHLLGPDGAAEYSVVLRLFFIAPVFLTMMLVPLWPAYGEAIARGDAAWVRRTLLRSTTGAVTAAGLASVALFVFAADILRAWVGPYFHPPVTLLAGMGIWAVVSSALTSVAMLLNGGSAVRFQAAIATVSATASVVLSVVLGRAVGSGGIIWGTLVAYVACTVVPTCIYVPRVLRRLEAADRAGPSPAPLVAE